MSLNVAHLQGTLSMNTGGFTTGIIKAQNAAKNLGGTVDSTIRTPMDKAAVAIDNTSTSLDNLSEQAETATDKTQDFSDANTDLSGIVKLLPDELQKVVTGMEDISTKSEGAGGKLSALIGIVGTAGSVLGITKIIDALKDLITKSTEAADTVTEKMRDIYIQTGAQMPDLESYRQMSEELSKGTHWTSEQMLSTIGSVRGANPGITNEQLEKLTPEYQAFAETIGTDVPSAIKIADAAFDKWGINIDEQAGYLQYFYQVQKQTEQSMADVLPYLKDGDDAFRLLGMDARESTIFISEMVKAGDSDGLSTLISGIERLRTEKAGVLGSDSEATAYIQTLVSSLDSIGDKTEVIGILQEQLGIGDKTAFALSESLGYGNLALDDMKTKAEEAVTPLRDIVHEFQTLEQIAESNTLKENPIINLASGTSLWDLLGSGAWAAYGGSSGMLTDLQYIQQFKQNTPADIKITQIFNGDNVDPYEVQKATERGAERGAHSVF